MIKHWLEFSIIGPILAATWYQYFYQFVYLDYGISCHDVCSSHFTWIIIKLILAEFSQLQTFTTHTDIFQRRSACTWYSEMSFGSNTDKKFLGNYQRHWNNSFSISHLEGTIWIPKLLTYSISMLIYMSKNSRIHSHHEQCLNDSCSTHLNVPCFVWHALTRATVNADIPSAVQIRIRATYWDCETVGTVKQSMYIIMRKGWKPWNSQACEVV